jgi:hypothetical protein
LLALFNCGEPGVDTSKVHRLLMAHGRWLMMMMTHVWTTKAQCVVVETPCRGHASSLDVARDLLVLLLLVVVKIPVLPPCARSLLPRCLRVMGEGHS